MAGLLVHEWLAKAGGSENVFSELIDTYPDASVQVLWNDAPDRFPAAAETWLARTPLRQSKALSLPLMIPTWRSLPSKQDHEWMLVSSHLFAHHARLRGNKHVPKLVYAHTPARYIWEPALDVRGANWPARIASVALRPLDRHRAQEARSIAANSKFTRRRIERTWGRSDARVIYPPVDTELIRSRTDWSTALTTDERAILESMPDNYLLGASRLVPYKRLDLVLEAGLATASPVVVAGSGPEGNALRNRARELGIAATFVESPSSSLLFALYQRARAYVFPATEDFGIMPVEAMACGTPVIVSDIGGGSESVSMLEGGVRMRDWGSSAWRSALDTIDSIERKELSARANSFSRKRFRDEIAEWVASEAS